MSLNSLLIIGALCCAGLTAFAAEGNEPGVRIRESWNAGWLFARQTKGTGDLGSFDRENQQAARVEPRFLKATEPGYDDSSWQEISLPHTWNQHDSADLKPGYWRGIGWYRKHFRVDKKYASKRVFLEFEAAGAVAEFWLNGRPLGSHKGGYTGFEFDATGFVRFGAEDNVLTVKVDNLFHNTIPPTVKSDYTFYGGIYRDAWIRYSEPVYLSDVHWTTPKVSEAAAELTVQGDVINRTAKDASLEVTQEVIDSQNKVVKTFSTKLLAAAGKTTSFTQQSGTIEKPQLWSPDSPTMYKIRTAIREAAKLTDSTEIPLGFRWFQLDPQRGFILNGKRVQLQGTNWHQVYPGMGNALPNSRHVKDMEAIREMGANFWRTSHYPHDAATMDASDRLGLMIWNELPINKEMGNPAEYIVNTSNMAREMILRDRNHPSVIMWGITGEINAPKSVSIRVVGATARLYREVDPSRPVVMHAPRGEEVEALVDIVGSGADRVTDEKHARFPNRIFMIGEYSASLSGRGIYGNQVGSDERAIAGHERTLRQLAKRPWMLGGCIWNQFEYEGETYDIVQPHVVAFGMADSWRIPKEPYYFYQSQWSTKPMVHIVGHWTWPGEEGKTRQVKVLSNADEVELILNGRSLGKKKDVADDGLAHPIRTWDVPYEAGTLQAVARVAGREISDERKTAGAPFQIILTSDTKKLTSGDPESLAYITAVVADRNGTVVPDSVNPISFTVYGPGELLEQTWPPFGTGLTWNAVAGMTRIAFRSTPRSGDAIISASSPGLKMGRVQLNVSAPGLMDEMNYKERFEEDDDEVGLAGKLGGAAKKK